MSQKPIIPIHEDKSKTKRRKWHVRGFKLSGDRVVQVGHGYGKNTDRLIIIHRPSHDGKSTVETKFGMSEDSAMALASLLAGSFQKKPMKNREI